MARSRSKKKSTFDKFGAAYKSLKCDKCTEIVKVDINADAVTCWRCTLNSLSGTRNKK